MMRRTPKLLADLVAHVERILEKRSEFADRAAFLADVGAKDAVLYNFIVLGEVARRLGEPFQEAHPSIPWRAMIAQRDVIAHGYDAIDWEQLSDTIDTDLPALLAAARRLLDGFGLPPGPSISGLEAPGRDPA